MKSTPDFILPKSISYRGYFEVFEGKEINHNNNRQKKSHLLSILVANFLPFPSRPVRPSLGHIIAILKEYEYKDGEL
jgi:hypothetical protein